eukprot:4813748-Pleurochrysis_carterae.AAC.2
MGQRTGPFLADSLRNIVVRIHLHELRDGSVGLDGAARGQQRGAASAVVGEGAGCARRGRAAQVQPHALAHEALPH